MVYLARAYDTGKGLGTRSVCWEESLYWYTQSVEAVEASDEEGNYDGTMDDPTYQLLGRMAEMYRDGGHGVKRDPSKAGKHFCTIALESTSVLIFCNRFTSRLLHQCGRCGHGCHERKVSKQILRVG